MGDQPVLRALTDPSAPKWAKEIQQGLIQIHSANLGQNLQLNSKINQLTQQCTNISQKLLQLNHSIAKLNSKAIAKDSSSNDPAEIMDRSQVSF
jgi:hypothetical protein